MTISFAQSPESLFDLAWLHQKDGVALVEEAIRSGRLGNDHEPACLLLHAMMLAEQNQPAEAAQMLSKALPDLPTDWHYSALKFAAAQYIHFNDRVQSIWHAHNAATVAFNNGKFKEIILEILPIYHAFCHGRSKDDKDDALLEDLLRHSAQSQKNHLEHQRQIVELQAEQAGLQAAMLAGEIPDDLDACWDRVMAAGLGAGVAELFCQSVILQVGHDSRTPTQLCRWFHLLEPCFSVELAERMDGMMAWYTSQPSDPHPDLHAELARTWWLRHRPPHHQRQGRQPDLAALPTRQPLRIGILDLPILHNGHCADSILPRLPPEAVTLLQYSTKAGPVPDWPALEAARRLDDPDALAVMRQDRLDILLILHNVPAEILLPLLIERPARYLASWWPDPATFGPDCLDAALATPEDITPLRTSLSFEPLVPLPVDSTDPARSFVEAMQRILALP